MLPSAHHSNGNMLTPPLAGRFASSCRAVWPYTTVTKPAAAPAVAVAEMQPCCRTDLQGHKQRPQQLQGRAGSTVQLSWQLPVRQCTGTDAAIRQVPAHVGSARAGGGGPCSHVCDAARRVACDPIPAAGGRPCCTIPAADVVRGAEQFPVVPLPHRFQQYVACKPTDHHASGHEAALSSLGDAGCAQFCSGLGCMS